MINDVEIQENAISASRRLRQALIEGMTEDEREVYSGLLFTFNPDNFTYANTDEENTRGNTNHAVYYMESLQAIAAHLSLYRAGKATFAYNVGDRVIWTAFALSPRDTVIQARRFEMGYGSNFHNSYQIDLMGNNGWTGEEYLKPLAR